jgi:hypothetical protein
VNVSTKIYNSSRYNKSVMRSTVNENRCSIRWTLAVYWPTKQASLEISLESTGWQLHSDALVRKQDTDRWGLEPSGMWRCVWQFECSLPTTALGDTGFHTLNNTVLGTCILLRHVSYTSYERYAACISFQIPDHLSEIFSNILFKEKQTRDLRNKMTPLFVFIFNSALHSRLLKQRSPSD